MNGIVATLVILFLSFDHSSGFRTSLSHKVVTTRCQSPASGFRLAASVDSVSTVSENRLKSVTTSFAKIFLASALFFCVTTTLSLPADASTAPAAQAIAAAEASGATLESLVPEEAPKVTKKSSPRALKVGERLKALNAKMYGAFWCSHCNNQKQALGVQVAQQFEYIECDKDGANTQYKICRSAKIPGYPTWEIKGELYPGEKDIGELETLLSSIEEDAKKQ